MTATEVRELLERELASDSERARRGGGSDLDRCLLAEPRLLEVSLPPPAVPGASEQVWLVLEERPGDPGGYQVVFSEQSRQFGLTVRDPRSRAILVGEYGSFLDALDAL